jgi:hypothetical protein
MICKRPARVSPGRGYLPLILAAVYLLHPLYPLPPLHPAEIPLPFPSNPPLGSPFLCRRVLCKGRGSPKWPCTSRILHPHHTHASRTSNTPRTSHARRHLNCERKIGCGEIRAAAAVSGDVLGYLGGNEGGGVGAAAGGVDAGG